MKNRLTVCFILLAAIAFGSLNEVNAQAAKLKIVPMSPGLRSSGPPNYTTPAGPWYVSTGLRVVGKGMKVYLKVDTTGSGATVANNFTWSFDGTPQGSMAAYDSAGSNIMNSFKADTTGWYYVAATVNGSVVARETLWASTYSGVTNFTSDCACHGGDPKFTGIYGTWKETGHARIFTEGITGKLEVDPTLGAGAYASGCIKCHTVGHEPSTNNGNFGYLANISGWDTSWYKPFPLMSGDYWIPYNDSTILKNIQSSYSQLAGLSAIGCESCHGPLAGHKTDFANAKKKVGVSPDAGVCIQCHDAPKKHRLGSYWAASKHGTFPEGGHTNRTSCYPCHSGTAFVKWVNNPASPGYDDSDGNMNIACVTCHNPHTLELNKTTLDSLRNGYQPPAGLGGKGLLCMNCHNGRYSVTARVTNTPPYYGFVTRYGPHENPQADMLFGSNGYQYSDARLTGQTTHAGLEDGCVTCHMAERVVGSSIHPNHQMSMDDTTNGFEPWNVCRECHGAEVNGFDDIKAHSDYDQNGQIEGVQTEVQGLLARLKAILPKDDDPTSDYFGEPVYYIKDSLKVKDRPDLVQGIWNYYFVKNDHSYGVHNTKYAVALLQKALGIYPTEVETVPGMPTEFELAQNYPNPFNPSTTIRFGLPQRSHVALAVYNTLGQKVAELINREFEAGYHEVRFDAGGLASGVYLYRIEAANFVSTKKLLLLK
jgi:Secretion system C-terminal sorting domain